MKRIFLRTAVLCICSALCLLAGCKKPAPEKVSAVGFYLDTVINISVYGVEQDVVDDALAKCADYERLLSKTVEGSDVWRINHAQGAPVRVDEHTRAVLETALAVSAASGGAFDATIAPASALWDFQVEAPAPPDAKELAEAAALTDYTKLKLDGDTVTLPAGMQIDLGGIAKGYIADEIAEYCRARGVKSGILNFGGNVVVIGTKPDGSDWRVGVQDPEQPTGEPLFALPAADGSVVTSGNYERYFILDGVRYHHILDPETGWPVQNGLSSVTILTHSSMLADAYSTACYVLGLEKGMALIEATPDVEAAFITADKEIIRSGGLSE